MMQKFKNNFFNSIFAIYGSFLFVFCPRGHLMDYHLPNVDNRGHLVNYHLPHFVHVVIERPLLYYGNVIKNGMELINRGIGDNCKQNGQ
jgi:hypothetical protein